MALHLHDVHESRATSARYLIHSVSKQNLSSVEAALEKITQTGFALHRYVLATSMASVLSERSVNEERLALLKSLVNKALDKENAISLVADIFESSPTVAQSAEKVYDLTSRLCAGSPTHQVLFLMSLCYSTTDGWKDVGVQALTRSLEKLSVDEVKSLFPPSHECNLIQLTMLSANIPSLRHLSESLFSFPALGSNTSEPFSTYEESFSIAKVVEELGPGCISTPEDCKELLAMFPAPLSDKMIAELLCLIACPSLLSQNETNSYNSLRVSFGLAESKTCSNVPPQTNVVVQAIKELQQAKDAQPNPKDQWNRILVALDQPHLRIERFATIAAAYKKGTNEQLPISVFLNESRHKWRNTSVQAAALKFAIDNPELVGKDALVGKVRTLPKEITMGEDVSELWRFEPFIDAAAYVSSRERDLDASITTAIAKAPSAILAGLLTCGTHTVRHFALAAQALRSSTSLSSIVTPALVQHLKTESCVPSLIGLLSELGQSEASRTFELAELCIKLGLADGVLKCSTNTRLVVETAVIGRDGNVTPDKWLENMLSDNNRGRPNQSVNRFAIASAILECADDLLTRQKYIPHATAALNALCNCTAAAAIPGLVAHAKLLLQGDAAFSPDVEQEATEFFQKMYADDSLNSISILERLHKSAVARDKQVLACIINILFDETRTLSDYPWKQLQTAARLFGQLINSDILGPTRLAQALKILLPTITKQSDMKTFEYGIIALEQAKMKMLEWPAVGKQLKNVVDLDMRIPGIMGLINQGIQKAIDEENAANGTTQQQAAAAAAATAAPGLHQLDIRVLMDSSSSYTLPPAVVQDQINFLVGNTDPGNLETSATDLATLLKPEFYSFFADYLVVKRVSLEPNFHRMYLQLIEKINSKELEKRIRTATVAAVKRLLASEKIRTDTSERSLLKNLGSWFGCITIAKNIPVLSKDLDFKEMVLQGLREGKLIAVVPFIAKVLDQCLNSRFFRPPNPWTMAQLGHLFEMYRLPDLKLTLRFEVEVLCKNINIGVAEVEDFMRSTYPQASRRGPQMIDVRNQLDINGSTDFRVEESRHTGGDSPAPRPKGLQADAPPYQPRAHTTVDVNPPPRPPIVITPETVRAGDELRHLPPARHQAYHQALVKTLEPALKEVQPHVERASVIAAYSTREIVIKDFARDPDPNLLRRAGQAMARSLASNLCTAIVKEHLHTALRKHIHILASHLTEAPQTRNEITEHVANNNFDLCVRFLEYQSSELAGRKVDELLVQVAEEKTNALRKGEPLPIPADQLGLSHLLAPLPEAIRPSGQMPTIQRTVYEDFFFCTPIVEQLTFMIRTIEEAALRHYQTPNAEVLSLTHQQFTEKQLSEHHTFIRTRLVELAHLITPETAVPLVSFVFQKLMDITENLSRIDIQRPDAKPIISTTQLLNEVFLFVIQSTVEKGKDKAITELTRVYLLHDRRWKYCDIIVNFMRLKVVDISKFDEALSRALQESQSNRSIVEFAGQVIQKVLIDDKLTTTKDLHQTLAMLEQIAKNRSANAATPAAATPAAPAPQKTPVQPAAQAPAAAVPAAAKPATPQTTSPAPAVAQSLYPTHVKGIRMRSLYPPERRAEIEPLFDEWIQICNKKAQLATDPTSPDSQSSTEQTQVLSMQYVKKLQQTNLLVTDKNQLDAFIGILIELSVEHYATVALEEERRSASVVPANLPKGAPPPPRFSFTSELFVKTDAFSDLVVLLVRCCSWSQSSNQPNENTARAEVALVGRVLQVATKVLQNNHDSIQNNAEGQALQNKELHYQRAFLQQPYVRIFSNLLIAIHRNHSEQPTSADPNVSTTTEEILRFFSDAFRQTMPLKAPGFTFGWLECVSHRLFVVRMLKNKKLWPNYVQLLCEALKFVEFFTKGGNGVHSNVLVFVKSFLKLMLILLHDFPEFVLSCHVQLCDAIPPCCVQLRNVVLCAFPQTVKLPDPFAPTLHIDRLAEMSQAPPIQDVYRKTMFANSAVSMDDIANFVHCNPRNASATFPRTVLEALRNSNGRWNVPLMNAVVHHTACTHLVMTQQQIPPNLADSSALELLRELAKNLDSEGRYYLLNSCVNHLRYPNSHTHYFSQVILHLFLPTTPQHVAQLADKQEVIQEQITRVLVERLIISRPHPWGLLITFIELIKNKRYAFWERGFIRCTPEIEKMFDNLLKSVSGSAPVTTSA